MANPGIMTRLRLEGQQTPADIIVGLDSTWVQELQELQIVTKPSYNPCPLYLPTPWPDTALIPVAYDIVSILSHGQNPGMMTTVDDILQGPRKLIIPDPRTSTTGLEFLYWISKTTRAPDFWPKLTKKVLTYPKGLSSSFALFMNCQDCLTVAYSTSPQLARHYYSKPVYTESIEAAPLQVYGLLITAKGQQHPLTNQIIAFMHSEIMQASIPYHDHLYPVIYNTLERFKDQLPPLPQRIIPPPFLTQEQKSQLIESWLNSTHAL